MGKNSQRNPQSLQIITNLKAINSSSVEQASCLRLSPTGKMPVLRLISCDCLETKTLVTTDIYRAIPHSEITEFIRNGYYFDESPQIEVKQHPENSHREGWEFINIHYQADKRPISIQITPKDQLLREEIAEALAFLNQPNQGQQQQQLIQKISSSQQLIAIEIDAPGLPDSAWEMLDCLEAYLAKELSGLIYAPDDGFYDEFLQPIYQFSSPTPENLAQNWDFTELWLDRNIFPPYVLMLIGNKKGLSCIYDPAVNYQMVFSAATYQEANHWLIDNQYEKLDQYLKAEKVA